MATLVFSGIGTMLGGPIGGAIGTLAGRQVDAALFGPGGRQGPRLKDLAVTTSTYGQIVPRHFGRMRVAGSIIWATELVEHDEAQGGGKGTPGTTTYSYTANFAVALSSRPILSVGRIWADGKLLRGAAGDLKVGGTLRIHTGHGNQAPDPLIAAAERAQRCPAHRDLAYAVFENLELAPFYNRIPSLTFEIIADESFDLGALVRDVVDDLEGSLPLPTILGYSSEGPPATDIETFDQVVPLAIDTAGGRLVIARERSHADLVGLPEAAIAVGDDDFGGTSGFTRHRAPASAQPPMILRYYDPGRDYQASVQRASGRAMAGEPGALDLPAAIEAASARTLIESAARRIDWSRDRVSWRTCELDASIAPGSLVSLPGIGGMWRVCEWEWRESGIELALQRHLPLGADMPPALATDPGRLNSLPDVLPGETGLFAFELPFDPASGGPDAPRCFAAVSSASPNWQGAALFADHGDGELLPLGPSGRRRAVMGTTVSILADANPLFLDRGAGLVVRLIDPGMQLASIDTQQLAAGANLAIVGEEILQFQHAFPLGNGYWRLSGLLRGRGGTEAAMALHIVGEPFALLGAGLASIDTSVLGSAAERQVVALGAGDAAPVQSRVRLDGITLRPLSPVHPRRTVQHDGTCTLSWTRRTRGGWAWQDGVDMPLVEEAELYRVTAGPLEAPLATWSVAAPRLDLPAALWSELAQMAPGAPLQVRQQGTHALSLPLTLCTLP